MTSPAATRGIFDRIARRYDLLTALLSLGQHARWKRLAAEACRLPPEGMALDVCAGTGDIGLDIERRGGQAVALDFSGSMLRMARGRKRRRRLAVVQADALCLPFARDAFHAAVVGFGLRYAASVPALLSEMARVVRPGGWVVSLETSQPTSLLVRVPYRLYLELVITVAGLFSQRAAYRYLLRTIVAFSPADWVAERFREAGLEDIVTTPLLLGAAAIHAGRVPAR